MCIAVGPLYDRFRTDRKVLLVYTGTDAATAAASSGSSSGGGDGGDAQQQGPGSAGDGGPGGAGGGVSGVGGGSLRGPGRGPPPAAATRCSSGSSSGAAAPQLISRLHGAGSPLMGLPRRATGARVLMSAGRVLMSAEQQVARRAAAAQVAQQRPAGRLRRCAVLAEDWGSVVQQRAAAVAARRGQCSGQAGQRLLLPRRQRCAMLGVKALL